MQKISNQSTRILLSLTAGAADEETIVVQPQEYHVNDFPDRAPISERLSGEDRFPYLQHDYKEGWDICYTAEGSVKAGTLEALMEHLTSHKPLNTSFVIIFLLTYRSFVTTEDLFAYLFKRFLLTPPPDLSADDLEVWREKKLDIVRVRAFNIMRIWLENYCLEEDADFLEQLHEFVTNSMIPHLRFAGECLIRLIAERVTSAN